MPNAKYSGATLVDETGTQVGEVRDVIYDESGNEPSWLVVKAGAFRSQHYVPVEGSYHDGDNSVVVPFTAQRIKAAPKAKGDHVLNSELRQDLARHYQLTGS